MLRCEQKQMLGGLAVTLMATHNERCFLFNASTSSLEVRDSELQLEQSFSVPNHVHSADYSSKNGLFVLADEHSVQLRDQRNRLIHKIATSAEGACACRFSLDESKLAVALSGQVPRLFVIDTKTALTVWEQRLPCRPESDLKIDCLPSGYRDSFIVSWSQGQAYWGSASYDAKGHLTSKRAELIHCVSTTTTQSVASTEFQHANHAIPVLDLASGRAKTIDVRLLHFRQGTSPSFHLVDFLEPTTVSIGTADGEVVLFDLDRDQVTGRLDAESLGMLMWLGNPKPDTLVSYHLKATASGRIADAQASLVAWKLSDDAR